MRRPATWSPFGWFWPWQRLKLSLWGLDVSTAFLYATLDEPQAVVLPASCVGDQGERLFLRLKKALYGLRAAPLAWFRELRRALLLMETHRHTDTQTHRHTDTQTHRHTDTQTHDRLILDNTPSIASIIPNDTDDVLHAGDAKEGSDNCRKRRGHAKKQE